MEHIVQFAVGIDDDRIVKTIEKYAAEHITSELSQKVANKLFKPRYCIHDADPNIDPLSDFTASLFKDFIQEHKDEIIERCSEMLSVRMMHSRNVRGKIIDKCMEVDNNENCSMV